MMNRVLLIDDNSTLREALLRQFSGLGFSVMGVGSADATRAMEAAPDFILFRANRDRSLIGENTGAWVYQLRENAPPELRSTPPGTQNDNTLFWHRRLQRALISASWSSVSLVLRNE
jgi:CheY-like chemotaxis protein